MVDSKAVSTAEARLKGLTRTAGGTQKATGSLTAAFTRLAIQIVGIHTAIRLVNSSFTKLVAFEKFGKQLEFVTGSAENATKEMEFLRTTAYENALVLEETVGPYTRVAESMRQLGLGAQDTRELFIGVANAAATFGLSADEVNGTLIAFSQVASKGTVQAEELRNQIGERIPGAFSLAARAMGITTEELNKMLELGQVKAVDFLPKFAAILQENYGGNLANVTDTLGGAMRRAQTATTDFIVALGESKDVGGVLSEVLMGTSEALRDLRGLMLLDDGLSNDTPLLLSAQNVRDTLITTVMLMEQAKLGWAGIAKGGEVAILGMSTAIQSFVSGIQNIGVYIQQGIQNGMVRGMESVIGAMPEDIQKMLLGAPLAVTEKAEMFSFLEGYIKQNNELTNTYGVATKEAWAELLGISEEADGFQDKFLARIVTAQKNAQAVLDGGFSEGETDGAFLQSFGDSSGALNKLTASLMTDEEKIEASYEAAFAVVEDYQNKFNKIAQFNADKSGISLFEAQEDLYAETGVNITEILARVEQDRSDKLADLRDDSAQTAVDRLTAQMDMENTVREDQFIEEEMRLLEQRDKRLEILEEAREAELEIEGGFAERKKQIEAQTDKELTDLRKRELANTRISMLQGNAQFLGMANTLTSQMQALAEEGSSASKALFAASKGIAIAQAVISTELAYTQALADPSNPTVFGKIPLATAIRAMGYASVGLMAGTAIGNFAEGGIIPGNSFTGDRLTANVNSGEMVLNGSQQKNLFDIASRGGGGGGVNINVINNAGVDVQVAERQGEDGEKRFEILLNKVETTLASRISNGGSRMSKSLESTYGVKRGNS